MKSNIIVGRNPVSEALKAGSPVEKILLLHGVKGANIDTIRALARTRGVPVVEAGKQKFLDLDPDAHAQGIIAILPVKEYSTVEDILAAAMSTGLPPFLLILDDIEDPQNLGALIRTAECSGVHGIIIPKHHAAGVTDTVVKASAGATEHMRIAQVTNIAATMEELKKGGLWMVGTEAGTSKAYDEQDYTMPLAVVIGNEGKGMRRLVRDRCDFLVRIPLSGKIQSLNASVAGALIMFEVVRSRRSAQSR